MPTKHYDAPGAIQRLPGETFASFSSRQKASQLAAKANQRVKRVRVRLSESKLSRKRTANRV